MSNRTKAAGSSSPRLARKDPTAVALATYLRKRPQGWIFRRAVPQDLQARFGLREIIRSLAHVPQSRAACEARKMGFACEDLFMEARRNTSISRDQLRAFGKLIAADKRAAFSTVQQPLRMRGVDKREVYEAYREVATASAEAAAEGRAFFEPAVLQRLAAEASIPPEVTSAAMSLLQNLTARATAAYCITAADDLHTPDGMLRRIFLPDDIEEERYRAAKERFENLGPINDIGDDAPAPELPGDAASLSAAGLPDTKVPCPSVPLVAPAPHRELEAIWTQPPSPSGGDAPATQSTGLFSPVERPAIEVRQPVDTADGSLDILFSLHWEEFVETKIAMSEWKPSRRAELDGTRKLVVRLIGDVSLLTFTREHAALFRKRYFSLPSDHKNMWFDLKAGRERTFEELTAYVAALDKKGLVRRVGAKTWNKQCGNVSAYIKHLNATVTALKSLENPFAALAVPLKKNQQAARLERAMAPEFALRALIATEVWTGRKSLHHLRGRGPYIIRDSLYWIPLMEICLGLRREEAAQLRVRHLTVKFGILGVNLFAADVSVKEEDGASRRWVPLSKALLDLGFVDCLLGGRDPDDLLFPELSNDNAHHAYGVSYGKRFSNYVKNVKPDFSDETLAGYENLEFSDQEKMDLMVPVAVSQ